MPDVIFNGPEGRLEGRYQPGRSPTSPIALMLHPHPQHGGTMNNKVVYTLHHTFARRGFAVLRFNFRGVGRSQGSFDRGEGELEPRTITTGAASEDKLEVLSGLEPGERVVASGNFLIAAESRVQSALEQW